MIIMTRIITSILLLFLVINTATSQINQETKLTTGEPIKLKFTGVTITPPKDYHYMEDISSFMNRDRETSISVTANDSISYYLMVGAILRSDFSGQETKLLSKEQVPGKLGIIFVFLFKVQGINVERMVYVTGDDRSSVSISANYKQSDKAAVIDELKKSILSVEF